MEIDKNYSDMVQAMTEDDNLHVRKKDYDELMGTEVREFFTILKNLEDRIELRVQRNKQQELKGKGHGKIKT